MTMKCSQYILLQIYTTWKDVNEFQILQKCLFKKSFTLHILGQRIVHILNFPEYNERLITKWKKS